MAQEINLLLTRDKSDGIKHCSIVDYSCLGYLTPTWELISNCKNCKDCLQLKIYFEEFSTEEKVFIKSDEVLIEETPLEEFLGDENYETSDIEVPIVSPKPTRRKRKNVKQENVSADDENYYEDKPEKRLKEEDYETKFIKTEKRPVPKPSKVPKNNNRKRTITDPYICGVCSATFATLARLRRHVHHRHLPDRPDKYCCTYCNPEKPFKSVQAFAWHIRRHHPSVGFKTKKFHCPKCNEEFKTLDARVEHYKDCGPKTDKPTCHVCHKNFTTWKSAVQHVEIMHLNMSKYVCDVCGHKSPRKQAHLEHMEMHKNNDDPRPYKCDKCGKGFKKLKPLREHLTLIHKFASDEESICDLCGEKFPTRSSLRYHVARTHKAREKINCEVCNKELLTKYSLRMHMSVVHKEFKETEKFSCDQCDYVGVKKRYLDLHKLQHADVKDKPKCSYCGKPFTNKNLVKRHEMIHTNSRPHLCLVCNRSFRHAFDLTSHMRLHNGEKPYRCQVCEQRFSDRGCFRAHLLNHEKQLNIKLNKSVKKPKIIVAESVKLESTE